MSNYNNYPGQNQPDFNKYDLRKKEKATPYYLACMAAYDQRPRYEEPEVPVFVDTRPKPKRTFFVVMIAILMAALIAVLALSYFSVMPGYTNLFSKVIDVDDPALNETIGVDDVINSSLKKFISYGESDDYRFYQECLLDIENAEIPQMIAYYALPVSILLALIVALYVFIKAIIAISSPKRRKFSYITLILLLFTLLGVAAGVVWNAQSFDQVLYFFTMSGTNMIIGFGYIIIVGIELVAWICSMFAYRSKKKAKY